MDGNLSDCSLPTSENGGSTWSQAWENEFISLASIGLGTCASGDILGQIEDKTLASKAVAFVVSSTRKGIVPLCADVASLFKAKRNLEARVALLSREVNLLRSSASPGRQTGQSNSPTTASLRSHSSSTCPDPPHVDVAHQRSPRAAQQRAPQGDDGRHVVKRHVSTSSSSDSVPCVLQSPPAIVPRTPPTRITASLPTKAAKTHVRKNSPPEIVTEPKTGLPKIKPTSSKYGQSVQVQCDIHSVAPPVVTDLEEQFKQSVRMNNKLTEDLGSAHTEIQMLKSRLKELEVQTSGRNNKLTDNYYIKDECHKESDCEPRQLSNPSVAKKPVCDASLDTPFILPGLLPGCLCAECCQPSTTGSNNGARLKSGLTDKKLTINHLRLGLSDHVRVKGQNSGHVRYIGHVDSLGKTNSVYVGLELDTPVGDSNGSLAGTDYFSCPSGRGLFVPVNYVISVASKKSSRLPSKSNSDKKKNEKNNNTITSCHDKKERESPPITTHL